MQLINCLIALGGDNRNTVPKPRITVAEAHALRAIHGAEALVDVEPLEEEVEVSLRGEITRLVEKYKSRDEDGQPIVARLFSGGGSSVPEDVEDLGLSESAFKVLSRVVAKPASRKAKAPAKAKKSIAPIEGEDPGSADHLFD